MIRYLLLPLLLVSQPLNAATYQATVLRVIDGDTVELSIQLWPGLTQSINLRINGINTPEKRLSCKRAKGRDLALCLCEKIYGLAATDTVEVLLSADTVTVYGIKHGKFAGRVLGGIITDDGTNVGDYLLEYGLAKQYHGKKRGRWCCSNNQE